MGQNSDGVGVSEYTKVNFGMKGGSESNHGAYFRGKASGGDADIVSGTHQLVQINGLSSQLDKMMNLRPSSFDWMDKAMGKSNEVRLMAQQLEFCAFALRSLP